MAFPGAWEISCDHNQILDVFSFVYRKLNFYSTHIIYILQLHMDDNYIMNIVFLFIHSIDIIWLWHGRDLFFLASYSHIQVRWEWRQSSSLMNFIRWYLDGWDAAIGASTFLHMTQMLIEPWRTRSAECFGSVRLVCSTEPHIVSQITGAFFSASLIHAPEVRVLYFRLEITSKRDVVFEGVW